MLVTIMTTLDNYFCSIRQTNWNVSPNEFNYLNSQIKFFKYALYLTLSDSESVRDLQTTKQRSLAKNLNSQYQ